MINTTILGRVYNKENALILTTDPVLISVEGGIYTLSNNIPTEHQTSGKTYEIIGVNNGDKSEALLHTIKF